MTKKQIYPVAVYFAHEKPENIEDHKSFFGCDLIFNAEEYQIVWPKALMDEPVIQANPELYEVFEKYVKEIMEQIDRDEPVSRIVNKHLLDLIQKNDATLEAVASRMAIGPRTLQRKLRDEGLSFNTLLGNVRKEIAVYHLKRDMLTITQISYLLGFSEPSVFHRSFKKWTGVTPADFRRRPAMA